MQAKVIILNEKFCGFPNDGNFKLKEETLPNLKDGEFLVEAEYLSVDPYMWVFMKEVGKPMMGEQVAKIIESRNSKYPVGQYVVAELGWRSLTVCKDKPGNFFGLRPRIITNFDNLPRSLALGVLGMPGNTAQFGFMDKCHSKSGNVIVVSAAAGAVGSIVGQLAKIIGCYVVGTTGSDIKGQRLLNELHFDAYINYKVEDFEKKLIELTPNKIDCYFDNVGGEISYSVLSRMNKGGHVLICGSISNYNENKSERKNTQNIIKSLQLKVEHFAVTGYRDRWAEGIEKNLKLVKEGKLKYFETITEGFENMPEAFINMLKGENFGKAIVKV